MKKIILILSLIAILILTAAGYYFFIKGAGNGKNGGIANVEKNGSVSGLAGKCETQYQHMLSLYGQDFSDCKMNITKSKDCSKASDDSVAQKQKNVAVIFDSSGSMAGLVEGKRKIDIAKSATAKFIDTLDSSTNLSIMVYGHKGSNSISSKAVSCAGIEEIYYMGKINTAVAKEKLGTFQPTGWTPIAASMEKARTILNSYPSDKNENMIILISDGKETCDGNPAAKAKELLGSNIKVATNVIGFDVSGEDEKMLRDISAGGGGKYFSVKSESEFDSAFKENKNFMVGFDCYMSQSDVWLGNDIELTQKRADCLHRLNLDEKSTLELNTNLENDEVTSDCKSYILLEYTKRYEQIKNEIETGYSQSRSEADQEKDKLKNNQDRLDAGEKVFQ